MENLKVTPLNEVHRTLGARMVPFGGWDMPVQYTSIIQEHLATRTAAGLFDVSHMGEIFLTGKKESLLSFLEKLTCNQVEPMHNFQVQYNAVLNENGGLVDDITIYKFNDEKYMICSNASNYEAVYAHLLKYNTNLTITNESPKWHQIAIQGPKANEIFSKYVGQNLEDIGYYKFKLVSFKGEDMIVSRTGYTGEDGFEIYSTIPTGVQIWSELLEFGKSYGLVPVGLGARDTLRLEAKYALYGHELNDTRTPVESGISWIVKEKANPYFAYGKIISQKKNGAEYGVTGIKLTEAGVLRENYSIFDEAGNLIGQTTSGSYSPSLKEGIGLAYIKKSFIKNETVVMVEIRGAKKKCIIQTGNFITGSVRKNK